MIGVIDRPAPGSALLGVQSGVARDGYPVARGRYRVAPCRGAIAVDHQTGIALVDEGRVEGPGETAPHPEHADVPGDVAVHRLRRDTKGPKASGNGAPRMVPDQHQWPGALRVDHARRRKVGRAEQSLRIGRRFAVIMAHVHLSTTADIAAGSGVGPHKATFGSEHQCAYAPASRSPTTAWSRRRC